MKPLGDSKTLSIAFNRGVIGLVQRRPVLVFTLVFASALLGWVALNARQTSLEKYKAELRAKGEKLTFAEIGTMETGEFSSTRMELMDAASTLGRFPVSPGALNLMVFVRPGVAQVAWAQPSPVWVQHGQGRVRSWNEFEAAIQSAAPTLDRMRLLLTNPPARWRAATSLHSAPFPNFVPNRLGAQWLVGEAISNLRQGDLEGALRDIEGIATWAEMNHADPSLVSQMIRVAVTGLGLSVTWEALQAPGWTEPQLVRLQKAWQKADLIDAIETGFLGVRASAEMNFARAHAMNGRNLRLLFEPWKTNVNAVTVFCDYIQFPIYRMTRLEDDELFVLRCAQDSIERIRSIKKGQPWVATEDGLNKGASLLANLSWLKAGFQYWISVRTLPNFVLAVQVATRNETQRQLTLTAIALKRHQLRHGYLPLNLAALSPEFLEKPGYDPLSGKPLEYVVRDDGRFLLYSVGKNGIDDGGEPKFILAWRQPGMWEDEDAVWPQGEHLEQLVGRAQAP